MAKIPDRSLYRKLQIVIEEAGKGRISRPEGLVETLIKSNPICFTYYRVEGDHPAKPVPCNRETYKHAVTLAIQLGLIDEHTGQVTKAGIKEINRDQFSAILRQRIKVVLNSKGFSFESLLEVIQGILSNTKSGTISSWDNIYDQLSKLYGEKMAIDRKDFHTFLTLIRHADGIAVSQKRIYLPYIPE